MALPVLDLAELASAVRRAELAGARDPRADAAADEALLRLRAAREEMDAPEDRAALSRSARALIARRESLETGGAPAPDAAPPTLAETLARLGVAELRPGQDRAIAAGLSGRDALVVMATGAGKSLCFQAPALSLPGLSLVVSPLIALIEDQAARLRTAGLPAAMLSSQMSEAEVRATLDDVRAGRVRLLYCAPERFNSGAFREAVGARGIELFVVDEAHCVSEWGHDFRPDYRRLAAFRDAVGARATIALTATATPRVQEDIVRRLQLRDPERVLTGFDRANVTLDAVWLEGTGSAARKWALLVSALRSEPLGPAIVYCGTRKATEETAARLAGEGFSTTCYHAGRGDRTEAQEAFMSGRAEVMCATNAFGMGIDKADVRRVIHVAITDSLEQYYQEAGRAGRDGQPARAVLLASSGDVGMIKRRISQARIGPEEVDRLLGRLARICDSEGRYALPRNDLDDAGEFAYTMAERVGALVGEPAFGGGRAGMLRADRLDRDAADALEREVRRELGRRWDALRDVTGYAEGSRCRRDVVLRHFGDPSPGAPEVRCCDVCDAPADLDQTRLPASAVRAGRAPAARATPDTPLPPALVAWRREVADAEGWPPFRVASNATLAEITAAHPRSRDELERVRGIGPWFMERYADQVLALIAGEPAPAQGALASPAIPAPAPAPARAPEPEVDADAFERLRTWRADRADGKPAYTVCKDAALKAALVARPTSPLELGAIEGIGPLFIERHGTSFLEVLAEIG